MPTRNNTRKILEVFSGLQPRVLKENNNASFHFRVVPRASMVKSLRKSDWLVNNFAAAKIFLTHVFIIFDVMNNFA